FIPPQKGLGRWESAVGELPHLFAQSAETGHSAAELCSAWAEETSAPTQPAACADEMSAHTKNRAEEKCIDPSLGVLRGARLKVVPFPGRGRPFSTSHSV
ncbi:MAG TPA: hypothetical protein VGV15_17585, partial [Terriglobales bacterium]|nr:hypothetical protein [Terriglobales bacterium]